MTLIRLGKKVGSSHSGQAAARARAYATRATTTCFAGSDPYKSLYCQCLSGWSGGGPVLQQFKPYTYNLYTDSCPRANMGDEADRAAQRAAARKAHETNAENQYPKWNEHTDQQFKQLKKQHDKKAYKSDTLEHYLIFTFFPELKKHQSVEEIRRTRTKAPPSAAQAGTATPAREAAPRAAAPPAAAAAQPARPAAAAPPQSAPPQHAAALPAGEGGGADSDGIGDGNSIRLVEAPAARSLAQRAAADDAEERSGADDDAGAKSSDQSSSETGADSQKSQKSKVSQKKKDQVDPLSGGASQGRKKRKATIVKDASHATATDSDENAQPKQKPRRKSSKADAGDDGHLEQPPKKRTSRHFSKSDSPILLEFKSFDDIRSKFQQRIWARDGYYRKDGAIDRKLNLENLLLTAKENYSKKTFTKLKAAFERSMDDPAEQ